MPVRCPASLDGARRCSATANRWREEDEGEKWMVEGASAEEEERLTGTSDQGVSAGVAWGVQGARAMWTTWSAESASGNSG